MSVINHQKIEPAAVKTAVVDASLNVPPPASLPELPATDQDELPAHLASFDPGQWAVGRWFVLRGAGFHVQLISQLRESECAAATDRLIAAQEASGRARREAIAALNEAIDALHSKSSQEEASRFKLLAGVLRKVCRGKLPDKGALQEFDALFELIRTAEAAQQQRRTEFENSFQKSLEDQSRTLRAVAGGAWFQEAVIWQNREAYQTAVLEVAQSPDSATRNKKQRQHEALVANYLQRYCVKNDTIGFFGPVAWGKIEFPDKTFQAIPGSSLISRRHTYFEEWAIDKVAQALSLLPGMEWWIAPRLMPYYRLQGNMLHSPTASPLRLGALAAAVLSLCDGQLPTGKIVSAVKQKPLFRCIDRMEIHRLLTGFVEQGVVRWRFSVPLEANAEGFLRRELLKVEEPLLRESALDRLERLESARSEVARAAGDATLLNAALQNLERTFESITRSSSRRQSGATYAGRTLVYEDCHRNLVLRAGTGMLDSIKPPLLLLLRSLRWFVKSTSAAFRKMLEDIYDASTLSRGNHEIPAEIFWLNIKSLLDSPPPAVTGIEALFKSKWASILRWESGRPRAHFTSAEIQDVVGKAFPEIAGDYHPVRYYCPDLMLVARDAGEIARGEALYVLGEMHLGNNTLCSTLFVEQHPQPQELIDALKWDFPEGRLCLINARYWPKVTTRTNQGVFHPSDYLLAASEDAIAPSGFRDHPISGLVVRKENGRLTAVSRDGSSSFEALVTFADLLTGFVMHKSSWFPGARHIPRVTIDQLVIQRETWTIPAGELSDILQKDPDRRFLAARTWARSQGIPMVFFLKSPIESKPFYVDLDSPVYVEIFCKTLRRLLAANPREEITLSEMLPAAEDTWLRDGAGGTYTSELRLAFVDLEERAACQRHLRHEGNCGLDI